MENKDSGCGHIPKKDSFEELMAILGHCVGDYIEKYRLNTFESPAWDGWDISGFLANTFRSMQAKNSQGDLESFYLQALILASLCSKLVSGDKIKADKVLQTAGLSLNEYRQTVALAETTKPALKYAYDLKKMFAQTNTVSSEVQFSASDFEALHESASRQTWINDHPQCTKDGLAPRKTSGILHLLNEKVEIIRPQNLDLMMEKYRGSLIVLDLQSELTRATSLIFKDQIELSLEEIETAAKQHSISHGVLSKLEIYNLVCCLKGAKCLVILDADSYFTSPNLKKSTVRMVKAVLDLLSILERANKDLLQPIFYKKPCLLDGGLHGIKGHDYRNLSLQNITNKPAQLYPGLSLPEQNQVLLNSGSENKAAQAGPIQYPELNDEVANYDELTDFKELRKKHFDARNAQIDMQFADLLSDLKAEYARTQSILNRLLSHVSASSPPTPTSTSLSSSSIYDSIDTQIENAQRDLYLCEAKIKMIEKEKYDTIQSLEEENLTGSPLPRTAAPPRPAPLISKYTPRAESQQGITDLPQQFKDKFIGMGKNGIQNLGNTCFMNAIIQCLSNTSMLTLYFLKDSQFNGAGMQVDLLASYQKMLTQLWSFETLYLKPGKFAAIITSLYPSFKGGKQHDAHEFLTILLDNMNERLKQLSKSMNMESTLIYDQCISRISKAKQNAACIDSSINRRQNESISDANWAAYCKENKTAITDCFSGQLRRTTVCTSCKQATYADEPFYYLQLEFMSSLEDAMDHFFAMESIDYQCEACSSEVKRLKAESLTTKTQESSSTRFRISQVPTYLIIQLKRFDWFNGVKIDGSIALNETLPLKKYMETDLQCSSNNISGHILYSLYAMVEHYGTMSGGHYTATCRNLKDNEWLKYDDSIVKCVSDPLKSQSLRKNAYILFYKLDTV